MEIYVKCEKTYAFIELSEVNEKRSYSYLKIDFKDIADCSSSFKDSIDSIFELLEKRDFTLADNYETSAELVIRAYANFIIETHYDFI